jgi:hypothetical protein
MRTPLANLQIFGPVKAIGIASAAGRAKLELFAVFCVENVLPIGNALTLISRFVYPRLHD